MSMRKRSIVGALVACAAACRSFTEAIMSAIDRMLLFAVEMVAVRAPSIALPSLRDVADHDAVANLFRPTQSHESIYHLRSAARGI